MTTWLKFNKTMGNEKGEMAPPPPRNSPTTCKWDSLPPAPRLGTLDTLQDDDENNGEFLVPPNDLQFKAYQNPKQVAHLTEFFEMKEKEDQEESQLLERRNAIDESDEREEGEEKEDDDDYVVTSFSCQNEKEEGDDEINFLSAFFSSPKKRRRHRRKKTGFTFSQWDEPNFPNPFFSSQVSLRSTSSLPAHFSTEKKLGVVTFFNKTTKTNWKLEIGDDQRLRCIECDQEDYVGHIFQNMNDFLKASVPTFANAPFY